MSVLTFYVAHNLRRCLVRWSWRVGRVAGIDISVHATFLLLLVWVAAIAYQTGRTVGAVVTGVVFVLAVFATIVLHELAHALTAKRFGIETKGITLLPIGGISNLERIPRDPRQELLIALAGPMVNVVLAILLYVALAVSGGVPSSMDIAGPTGAVFSRAFLAQFMAVNVWLAVFNLVPAFPMDGGRVLRAIVAMRRHDYASATATAAKVGRVLALVFGVLGLFVLNNPFLVLIALFIWLSAAGEAAAEQTTAMLDGVPIPAVMATDVHTLAPTDSLARAVQVLIEGFQQDFPVVDRGEVVGILTRQALFKALAERGEQGDVGAVMQREFPSVRPEEPIATALARLRGNAGPLLPVIQDHRLLGVITLENVGEFVAVRAARHKGAA